MKALIQRGEKWAQRVHTHWPFLVSDNGMKLSLENNQANIIPTSSACGVLCASQLPACAKEKAVSKPVHGLRGREVQLINMGVGIGLPELGMYVCRHACFCKLSIYNSISIRLKSLSLSLSLSSLRKPLVPLHLRFHCQKAAPPLKSKCQAVFKSMNRKKSTGAERTTTAL